MSSAHLKIEAGPTRIQYLADGIQAGFVFPFAVFRAEDVGVLLDAASVTAGFVVSGIGQTDGGTVTFDAPPAAGTRITLIRAIEIRRATDILQGSALRADVFNDEFDRLTAIAQDLAEAQSRALTAPPHDPPADLVLPPAAERADRVLVFDSSGNAGLGTVDTSGGVTPLYTAPHDGAVARSVPSRLAERVSAKDFGAAGDGESDDSAAIAAALSAAGRVYLPPGTYRVASPVVLGAGQGLAGAGPGTVIAALGTLAATVRLAASDARLADLAIEGGDIGLHLAGDGGACRRNRVERVAIDGAGRGLVLDGGDGAGTPCEANAITDLVVRAPVTHAVHLTAGLSGTPPAGNRFIGLQVDAEDSAMTGSGVYLEAGDHRNAFTDCATLVGASAHSCFRLGARAARTQITNLRTKSSAAISNLELAPGAQENTIVNLVAGAPGAPIWNQSTGTLHAINADWPWRTRLPATKIADLEADTATVIDEVHRFASWSGTTSVWGDPTMRAHFVEVGGAVVEFRLPRASDWAGRIVFLKRTDGGGGRIDIVDNGGALIDGRQATWALTADFATAVLASDGTVWRLMAGG